MFGRTSTEGQPSSAEDQSHSVEGQVAASSSNATPSQSNITGKILASATVKVSFLNPDRTITPKIPRAKLSLAREDDSYETTMYVEEGGKIFLKAHVTSELPTVFEQNSLIFNLTAESKFQAFHLEFENRDEEVRLKTAWAVALWEAAQQDSFSKNGQNDEWLYNQDRETKLASLPPIAPIESDAMDFDPTNDNNRLSVLSDEDESDDESESRAPVYRSTPSRRTTGGGPINEQLAVSMLSELSFVARGNSLSVFDQESSSGKLRSIEQKIPISSAGSNFTPSQMMLHQGDTRMLMLSSKNGNTVYEMDIERGKIVNEFGGTCDDFTFRQVAPVSKYAGRTAESTFVGVNNNSVFVMDPRLNTHNKVAVVKSMVSNPKFSTLASTGQGEYAVGSERGTISLYNDFGKRAKSALPGLGDPIIGLDITEQGSWLLGTCKTYLILINTRPDGVKANGFNTSITKHIEPPIKLCLNPVDIQRFNITNLSFTPAHFNTGNNIDEQWIVTSTGQLIITWNFRLLKENPAKYKFEYKLKQCAEHVVADQFVFNQENKLVVALEDTIYTQSRSIKRSSK